MLRKFKQLARFRLFSGGSSGEPIDRTPSGNWLLRTGVWDDSGEWDIYDVWVD